MLKGNYSYEYWSTLERSKIMSEIKAVTNNFEHGWVEQKELIPKEDFENLAGVVAETVELHKSLSGVVSSLSASNHKTKELLEEIKKTTSHLSEQYIVDRLDYQSTIEDITSDIARIMRHHDKEMDTIILAQTNIQASIEDTNKHLDIMRDRVDLELEKTRDKMHSMTNKVLIGLAGSLGVISGLLLTLINVVMG